MDRTGLTLERLFAWSAESRDNAIICTQILVVLGVAAYIVRRVRSKHFGLFEIGAGAATLFVVVREQRGGRSFRRLGRDIVIVRGVGNVWDGICADVKAQETENECASAHCIETFTAVVQRRVHDAMPNYSRTNQRGS
jgi:hypothetical protein